MMKTSKKKLTPYGFLENVLKQNFLALAVLLCLQTPILFVFYASKVSLDWPNNDEHINHGTLNLKSTDKQKIVKMQDNVEQHTHTTVLPPCPIKPPGLQGPLDVSFSSAPYEIRQIEENNPLVLQGGYFKPPFCIALSKVAIVIPFRDRDKHLRYFLQYMHPILQRQLLEYRIYVVNQFGNGKFNRAKLMNIGFAEAVKDFDFACFVFHDVDLILENDHALYSCPKQPRHMSSAVDKFNYEILYDEIFGGVTGMRKEHFLKVNGYSNSFWGWGGEDDDMYYRVRLGYFRMTRYPLDIGRYRMIPHQREKGNEDNPTRHEMVKSLTQHQMQQNGLNSLNYNVTSREDLSLYTNITVDIFAPKDQSD